jgi:hypothetical protein
MMADLQSEIMQVVVVARQVLEEMHRQPRPAMEVKASILQLKALVQLTVVVAVVEHGKLQQQQLVVMVAVAQVEQKLQALRKEQMGLAEAVAVEAVPIPIVHQDAAALALFLLLIVSLMIALLIHPHQAITRQ